MKLKRLRLFLVLPYSLFHLLLLPAVAVAQPTAEEIVASLKRSYQRLSGYRTETEVSEYRKGKLQAKKRFLYSFKKPHSFRIEMREPHRGTVLVCCDAAGKVVVQAGGLASLIKPHLAPDSRFFATESGQRIDQTDLGLLIDNIGHSLTDRRRGELKVAEEGERLVVETVADDHFLPGVATRYRFSIDKTTWLPAGLVESTPDGVLKRVVKFGAVTPVADFPPSFFDTEP